MSKEEETWYKANEVTKEDSNVNLDTFLTHPDKE